MANAPEIRESIFKFACFRPPERIGQGALRTRFAVDVSGLKTPFRLAMERLAGAENAQAQAQSLAKTFLASDAYLDPYKIQAKGPVDYIGLSQAVRIGLDTEDPENAVVAGVRETLERPAKALVRDDDFVSFGAALWDSLYANHLAGPDRAYDREPLLSAIRLHHLIHALAELDDDAEELPEGVEAYLRALPVVPPLLAGAADDQSVDDGKSASDDRKDPKRAATTQRLRPVLGALGLAGNASDLNDTEEGARLGIRLAVADSAIEELREALSKQQRAKLRDAGRLAQMTPGAVDGAADLAWSARAALRRRLATPMPDAKTATSEPFLFHTLSDEAVDGLSAETVDLLEQIGASPEMLTVPVLIERIESNTRQAMAGYAAGQSKPQAHRIGSVYVSAHQPNLSGLGPGGPIKPSTPPPQGRIRNKGIADLMVVEQQLLRYELGEVAHIENVLASEKRERSHRRLSRIEQEAIRETETTDESERDLQTTDRFEMQRETQSVQQLDASVQAGVTVTGTFGPVQTTAYADAALQISRTESQRQSTEYARDVTERSVARVIEREFERITRRTLEEIEERNLHGFDNTGDGAANICGVYRWVDKVYQAQIVNYGRRLMIELIVPEPAAFYKHAQRHSSLPGVTLDEPKVPTVVEPHSGGGYVERELTSPAQLTRTNYIGPVGQLSVAGVKQPPAEQTIVADALIQEVSGPPTVKASSQIKVPDGYVAATAEFHGWKDGAPGEWVYFGIGNFWTHSFDGLTPLNWEDQMVPVVVLALATPVAFNIEVTCQLRPEAFAQWQIETFNTIMEAYKNRRDAYNDQIAAATIRQGVSITGRNPAKNREIEAQELKKACIRIISGTDYSEFDAMRPGGSAAVIPEFDVTESMSEGRVIQFFEQAFEWEQVTYLFYPYFWGNRATWLESQQIDDVDPLFAKFLKAGAARVLVPVRPPFNDAVLSYLSHPQPPSDPWVGANAPIVGTNDPLYVSLAEELRAATGGRVDSEPVGEPWTYKIPTSLVYLQDDAVLPDFTNGDN